MQEKRYSIANALDLHLSCTHPSIYIKSMSTNFPELLPSSIKSLVIIYFLGTFRFGQGSFLYSLMPHKSEQFADDIFKCFFLNHNHSNLHYSELCFFCWYQWNISRLFSHFVSPKKLARLTSLPALVWSALALVFLPLGFATPGRYAMPHLLVASPADERKKICNKIASLSVEKK